MTAPVPSQRLLCLAGVSWVGFVASAAAARAADADWWQAAVVGLGGSTAAACALLPIYLRTAAPPRRAPEERALPSTALAGQPTPTPPPAHVLVARDRLDLALTAADAIAERGQELADVEIASAVLDVHQARLAYARALLVEGLALPDELANHLVIGHRSVEAVLASYRGSR